MDRGAGSSNDMCSRACETIGGGYGLPKNSTDLQPAFTLVVQMYHGVCVCVSVSLELRLRSANGRAVL